MRGRAAGAASVDPRIYQTRLISSFVIAGLVPAISMALARPCHLNRDHRDKPGDDNEAIIRIAY
jgi:hypothetical protein